MPSGKLNVALVAGPPAPPNADIPVPASVVMMPGRCEAVDDIVADAVADTDGVCVAVTLTSAGRGEELLLEGVPVGVDGDSKAAGRQGSATPPDAIAPGTLV